MTLRTLLPIVTLLLAAACSADPAAQTPAPPAAVSTTAPSEAEDERYALLRESMVSRQIESRGVEDPRVLQVMRTVPRHRFVLDSYLDAAYSDTALPIAEGQTISQPYIVALMSQLLQVEPGDRILEIGTGSGYQAAVLAEMGAEVFSAEVIPALAGSARELLDELGYSAVVTALRDGYFGWEEEAPFDAIIVTAAPDHVPPSLLTQVKPGGRVVIPVGPPGQTQTLWLMVQQNGKWVSYNQGAVIFVPLVGGP